MIKIDGNTLNLQRFIDVAVHRQPVSLAEEAKGKIQESRDLVERYVEEERVAYGITTGFGKFSDVAISKEETEELQRNLIISHSCGVGNPFSEEEARGIMLLRANALAKGFSGVRIKTIETLIEMLNKGVHPIIPEKGSLGASGDLAPLSHMVLVMIGEGEAIYKGKRMEGKDAMTEAGIETIVLTAKEGLGLINGTQAMTSVGALTLHKAIVLAKMSDISSALTIEALNGITDAFDPKLHAVRPHAGQINTAANLRRLLDQSKLTTRQGEIRVQDAYSLRCIPQIHGATKDTLRYVLEKVEIEMNSVTDNPVIFTEEDHVISGGNFHGQPMALTFDYLGIAMAEVANAAERRIERLVNPQLSGLPAFLTEKGGLHSGFMIAQYSAAALVSENKVLAHPASVDSIPSSANQEDHVSMGTIAARKARDIVYNSSRVLGIELMSAAQGIEFQEHKEMGLGTKPVYDTIRAELAPLKEDRILYKDINITSGLIDNEKILQAVEKAIGDLSI